MIRRLVLCLVAIMLFLSGCSGTAPATAVLQGKVIIGPLTPVERPGVTPTVPPEVYAARKVMVYDTDGKNLVRQVDIDSTGHYRVQLEPGTYSVDINHAGIDRSRDVPKKVEIKPGEIVQLDIDIDTGIR